MRSIHGVALAGLMCVLLAPASRAQGISINATITGEVVPGVYGQVVLGNRPAPPVVYAQPVVVQPAPVIVGAAPIEPIYLHVPPGHARHWSKHCHEYQACNRPVYFVRSAEYDPGYRGPRENEHGHGRGHGHGHHDED